MYEGMSERRDKGAQEVDGKGDEGRDGGDGAKTAEGDRSEENERR